MERASVARQNGHRPSGVDDIHAELHFNAQPDKLDFLSRMALSSAEANPSRPIPSHFDIVHVRFPPPLFHQQVIILVIGLLKVHQSSRDCFIVSLKSVRPVSPPNVYMKAYT